VTAPGRVPAQHRSLLHFVGNAPWSDERVLAKVCALVLPPIERQGPIEAWIIDDTSFPKKGMHSVGVARQYWSLPVAYWLYLPQAWALAGRMAADRMARRREAADQILAFEPARGHWLCPPGPSDQTALAHRARLSGAQAGGRAWAF
jgi:hypothetical protein